MSKLLERLIGVSYPTVEQIEANQKARLEQEALVAEQSGPITRLVFSLEQNGNMNFDIVWPRQLTDENARGLAKLIYTVNEGQFKQVLAQLLMKAANAQTEQAPFFKEILEEWEELFEEDENQPVVEPSEVLPAGQ